MISHGSWHGKLGSTVAQEDVGEIAKPTEALGTRYFLSATAIRSRRRLLPFIIIYEDR